MGIHDSISDQEFVLFQRLIHSTAGINLTGTKKTLLAGRLARRVQALGLQSFGDYYRLLTAVGERDELQTMVNLLTTNETYFFREPAHFTFLRDRLLPGRRPDSRFRVWSAASSSGEEAYSIAMVLADRLGFGAWEVVGSDISTQVLERAVTGHYPLQRTEGFPPGFMARYCRKGIRAQAGTFMVSPELRQWVSFQRINLMNPVEAGIGQFDVIFLRNVMIYFDAPTKARVIANILPRLVSGGHLVIGHSESITGLTDSLQQVIPTVYQKP